MVPARLSRRAVLGLLAGAPLLPLARKLAPEPPEARRRYYTRECRFPFGDPECRVDEEQLRRAIEELADEAPTFELDDDEALRAILLPDFEFVSFAAVRDPVDPSTAFKGFS